MSKEAKIKKPNEDSQPNYELSKMINELAEYEKNVNRQMHKYKAYKKAAISVLNHPSKIKSGKEAKALEGVGAKISAKIDEYLKDGIIKKLEKVRNNDTANSIKELTRVTGIGPSAAKKFVESGILSIEDLKANESLLNHHQKIGLKYLEDFEQRIPRSEMINMQDLILKLIKKIDDKYEMTICGSFRRGAESSGDIDVLLTHPNYLATNKKNEETTLLKEVVDVLIKEKFITDSLAFGKTKFMGVCKTNDSKYFRRIDIRLIYKDQYYCGILYFTGSDMFNVHMRKIALEKGYTLNEYSLRKIGTTGIPGKSVSINSEEEIFKYLDMDYKQPEYRNM